MSKFILFMIRNMVWFIIIIIATIFCLMDKRMFTVQTMINVLEHSSILGILVVGMTFCLLTAHFDLSTESTLGFTALVGAWMVSPNPWASGWLLPSYFAVFLMLVIGVGVGCINSFFILTLKINPFIVTLAMLIALRGITKIWTRARTVYDMPYDFVAMGYYRLGIVPVSVIFFVGLFVIGQLVLSYTEFGRELYAIGGSRNAAFVAGVSVKRRILTAYIISGVLAAVAGWILAGRFQATTITIGEGMVFEVFGAAVIGGVSLTGGKGNLIGPLGGVLLLGVIAAGLSILPISPYWVDAARGLIILAAVVLDRLTLMYEEKLLQTPVLKS